MFSQNVRGATITTVPGKFCYLFSLLHHNFANQFDPENSCFESFESWICSHIKSNFSDAICKNSSRKIRRP